MFFLRIILLLLAMALNFAKQDKNCEGPTERTFFNFLIEISDIPDKCIRSDDFEDIGIAIQAVIDEIAEAIPDSVNEAMQADVCSEPITDPPTRSLLRDSMHRRMQATRYAYKGFGTCKRCTTNTRTTAGTISGRRSLANNTRSSDPVGLACEMVKEAEKTADTAEEACEFAIVALERMYDLAKKKKGNEYKKAMELVKMAEKALTNCKLVQASAKASATLVDETCKEAEKSVKNDESFDYQLELQIVAERLQESCIKDAKSATNNFNSIQEGLLKLMFGNRTATQQEKNEVLTILKNDVSNLDDLKGFHIDYDSHGEQSMEVEIICELADATDESSFIAERAYEDGQATFDEIYAIADSADKKKQIEHEEAIKTIGNAEMILADTKTRFDIVKARAKIAGLSCKEAEKSLSVEPLKYHLELETVANGLEKSSGKEAVIAQDEFYKINDMKIDLKTVVTEAQFGERKDGLGELVNVREEELKAKIKNLDLDIAELEYMTEVAKDEDDNDAVERLEEEVEALKGIREATEKELRVVQHDYTEEFDQDYAFAKGVLKVEAADSTMDWLEEFADLIELMLPETLVLAYSVNDKRCYSKKPHVNVKVEALGEDRKAMFTLKDCDSS